MHIAQCSCRVNGLRNPLIYCIRMLFIVYTHALCKCIQTIYKQGTVHDVMYAHAHINRAIHKKEDKKNMRC